eukprot:15330515-Ditylum_brightwellii.AAC.1
MVERARRRPRIMILNKKHVKDIWGDSGKKEINIPRIIDNYNHWMGGVDISGQRVAYYHPNVHCCHNWVPIFLQILSIMHNNACLVHRDHHGTDTLPHKRFTMEWVKLAMERAHLILMTSFLIPTKEKRTQEAAQKSGIREEFSWCFPLLFCFVQ